MKKEFLFLLMILLIFPSFAIAEPQYIYLGANRMVLGSDVPYLGYVSPYLIGAGLDAATVTALKAAGYTLVAGNSFTVSSTTEPGALDLSGDDCTEADPCSITLSGDWTQAGAGLTIGDWWTTAGAGNQISGAVTGGANNVIQRVEFK